MLSLKHPVIFNSNNRLRKTDRNSRAKFGPKSVNAVVNKSIENIHTNYCNAWLDTHLSHA